MKSSVFGLILIILFLISPLAPVYADSGSNDWFSGIAEFFNNIGNAIASGVSSIADAISNAFNSIGNSISNAFRGIGSFISNITGFLGGLASFIVKSIQTAINSFTAFTSGYSTFTSTLLGNYGDTRTYNDIVVKSFSNKLLRQALTNCTAGYKVELPASAFGYNSDKPFCNYINEIQPSGFLGYIAYMVNSAETGVQIMLLIGKYFTYLLVAVSLFILVIGINESMKTRSSNPVLRSLEILFKLYTFPIWVAIKIVKFFSDAIKTIVQTVKSLLPF